MIFNCPSSAIIVWRIRLCIAMLLLCFMLGGLCVLFFYIAVVFFALSTVLFFLCFIIYIPKKVFSSTLTVSSGAVVYSTGVIMLTDYIIPSKRILFAEQRSTPIARLFSLSDIRLNAARGKVYVFLLNKYDAEQIINHLNSEVKIGNTCS